MQIVWTVLAAILVFGAVIFIHELGHFLTAKWSRIKVNEFAMGMGPKLFGFTRGDTTYCLRLFPIGGSCTMEGEDEESDEERSFGKAPVGKRILVIIAGAVMNLVLGFSVLFGITATSEVIPTLTIAKFADDAITPASGLHVDDTIVAVNGRNLYVIDDLYYELMRAEDYKADVMVKRGGEKILLEDVQFKSEMVNGVEILRMDFWVYRAEKTFGTVIKESALWSVSIARQIFMSLVDLVTGNVMINQLSGPVGIVSVISEAASVSFSSVLVIMAFISINLGVFNMLPLPALDGGRLIFLLFEAVTKKKLKPKYEAVVHFVGIILLFGLMIFVTYNDITKLFTR
jgi:Predicted membrane-associated Zn-dependent proteases 1